MAGGQEMTYGRSILEDLRLAEEAGMVFPEAVVEAEADELEGLNTRELRERGRALGVVPVGDGRTAEAWRLGPKAARRAVQRAVAVAAVAAAEALALAESAAVAGAEAVAELRRQGFSVSARGRVRELAPSDGWQTTAEAVGGGWWRTNRRTWWKTTKSLLTRCGIVARPRESESELSLKASKNREAPGIWWHAPSPVELLVGLAG
jgi:hypothetical protein